VVEWGNGGGDRYSVKQFVRVCDAKKGVGLGVIKRGEDEVWLREGGKEKSNQRGEKGHLWRKSRKKSKSKRH